MIRRAARSKLGTFLRAWIVIGIVIALVGGGPSLVDALRTPEVPAPPRGLSSGSLLRPPAFGVALMRMHTYGRLTNLRVAPERINATLLTTGGALHSVQVLPGDEGPQLGSATAGYTEVATMAPALIDSAAPQRLTRSAAERLGLPTSHVNYVFHMQYAGASSWEVVFRDGQRFRADGHGRITRRTG